MALSDIIERIEANKDAEVARITEAAEARASAVREEADQAAEESSASTIAEAEREAKRETSRIVVSARLGARDEALTSRHVLLDEALLEMERRLAELPDEAYAAFIARQVASLAQGGEQLQLGSADLARREAILGALRELRPDLTLDIDEKPGAFDRGARLVGHRVRADLTLGSLIEERREELESVLVRELFGKGV